MKSQRGAETEDTGSIELVPSIQSHSFETYPGHICSALGARARAGGEVGVKSPLISPLRAPLDNRLPGTWSGSRSFPGYRRFIGSCIPPIKFIPLHFRPALPSSPSPRSCAGATLRKFPRLSSFFRMRSSLLHLFSLPHKTFYIIALWALKAPLALPFSPLFSF